MVQINVCGDDTNLPSRSLLMRLLELAMVTKRSESAELGVVSKQAFRKWTSKQSLVILHI